MSNTKVKQKRAALKVSKISKTLNVSSVLFPANQSITKSSSTLFSRRSFSSTEDAKPLDKSSVQTPKHTVRDEKGQDVTPQPLYQGDPAVSQPKQGKLFTTHDTSWGTTTDFLSVAFQTNASFGAPFTRSFFGSISASRTSQSTAESVNNETEDVSKHDLSNSSSDVQGRKEDVMEQVGEVLMDNGVDCYLTETETMWLLDIPAVSVSSDSKNAEAVKERNKAYIELCKHRQGNDKYVERSMQTFNGAAKTKEVQSETVTMVDKAVMSTIWDMYDSFCSGSGEVKEDTAIPFERHKAVVPDVSSVSLQTHPKDSSNSVSMISTGSDLSSQIELEGSVSLGKEEPDPELILQSDKFKHDLAVMERVVLENIFQPKLAAYRQLPVLEDPDYVRTEMEVEEVSWTEQPPGPFLEHLWAFRCDLTMGRNVSSMAWNKRNPDLLAVGYGQFDFKDQNSGLVCCWSLKNPTWPERIFHCDSGVTALDFSSYNASQLAVGMYDGSVSIYNVQSTEETAIIDRSDSANMHRGPVWQLRWIDHEKGRSSEDKEETLISVSADGRISKWFLHKGMKRTDLMKLRRTKDRSEKSTKVNTPKNRCEVLISRLASGPCFDFHPKDSNIYLAGTEEGEIHKCSYSYSEQFLDTYQAHKGSVYKITWSPFSPDVFLSCSSDWTIQLWKQDLCTPVLSFTSSQKALYDAVWSPHCATVFGSVSESRVEIWDLRVSILDPIIVSMSSPGVNPSTLLFTPETDCVLVGDSEGQVSVYKLKNFTAADSTQVDALEDIIQSTLASHL
ncbi:dynein axonemal intermediate chain 4 [Triplophysa rosa]|uniref:dynein axonemal intermediate chain 4 n=1 Tax=Triplophysa rosa TaxID=992332 RepID=UPI002545DE48|nr:dynein axonemal intermediate chain 4 [Triplophysa rosa]